MMDYAWLVVFALALVAGFLLGLMVGFDRGQREADEDWQEIWAHQENLISHLRRAQMRPLSTPPKESE
jgi:hypothetical protein